MARLFSVPATHTSSAIDARKKLLHAHAVCFDVDSTVITEEGIDVLAEFNGAGAAVAEWTRKFVLFMILEMSFFFRPYQNRIQQTFKNVFTELWVVRYYFKMR